MLIASGFSEREGGMRLSAMGSSVWRKHLLSMDNVREAAFPDTGLKANRCSRGS